MKVTVSRRRGRGDDNMSSFPSVCDRQGARLWPGHAARVE